MVWDGLQRFSGLQVCAYVDIHLLAPDRTPRDDPPSLCDKPPMRDTPVIPPDDAHDSSALSPDAPADGTRTAEATRAIDAEAADVLAAASVEAEVGPQAKT